ncbi:hypothetical protein S83_016108 [Arachis hypogaea]
MLANPKEAKAGIREVHFFPFNPGDKRTTLTYIESDGKWHRSSKGALSRKYLRNQKMLMVHHGNLLRCYHYLILPGMIALKPSQEP